MTSKGFVIRILIFVIIAGAGFVTDLATKAWIFARLGMPGEKPVWWLIPNVFGFQTSLNEGALFGMGQGMTPWFALLSVLFALGIVLWLFFGGAARSWWMTISLAAITAGIFGNLYDRLGLHGLKWHETNAVHQVGEPAYAVRDWILVMIGRWPWPNFNIADSLLVCGVTALVIYTLWFSEAAAQGRAAEGAKFVAPGDHVGPG